MQMIMLTKREGNTMRFVVTASITSIALFISWLACDIVCFITFPQLRRYENLFGIFQFIIACVPVYLEYSLPCEKRSFIRGIVISVVSVIAGFLLVIIFGIGMHVSMKGSL